MAVIFLALAGLAWPVDPPESATSADPVLHSGMGTPFTLTKGQGAAGVFQPLTVGLGPQTQIGTSAPLFALAAPRIRIKHRMGEWRGVHAAAVGSVGVPTLGLGLLSSLGVISSDPDQQVTAAMVLEGGGVLGTRTDRWSQGLTATVRLAGRGPNWGLESPGLPFFDTVLTPLTQGPVLCIRHVNEWTALRKSGRDTLGLRSDVRLQLGETSPDVQLSALLSWAPHPRWVLVGGWAGAYETLLQTRKWTALPVGDLQVRW